MLPKSLLVFASTWALASAGPLKKRCESSTAAATASATESASAPATVTESVSVAASPTLPVTGGTTELPAATGTLKAIAVGHGIQNYTCSAANVTATSAGALAVLYDITNLYASLSDAEQTQLPVDLLHTTDLPLNMASTDGENEYAASVSDPFKTDAAVTVQGISQPLQVLGRHYFDSGLLPTFDLYNAGLFFKGGKLSNVHAPSTADAGLLGTGAVDWLQLGDKGTSVGLTEVYRVVTAGGQYLACDEAGQTFSVPYASQYWFYD